MKLLLFQANIKFDCCLLYFFSVQFSKCWKIKFFEQGDYSVFLKLFFCHAFVGIGLQPQMIDCGGDLF